MYQKNFTKCVAAGENYSDGNIMYLYFNEFSLCDTHQVREYFMVHHIVFMVVNVENDI